MYPFPKQGTKKISHGDSGDLQRKAHSPADLPLCFFKRQRRRKRENWKIGKMKWPAPTHFGAARVYGFLINQMNTIQVPGLTHLMCPPSHLRGAGTWRKTYRSKIYGVDHQGRGLRGQRSSKNTSFPPGAGQQGGLVWPPGGTHTEPHKSVSTWMFSTQKALMAAGCHP